MREVSRDKGRLEHMVNAIDHALAYTEGLTLEQLKNDSLREHATIYNVQIIGEAVYMLTKEFKAAHPETPWRQIEKMRHILVHDYYQIDVNVLWAVVTEDLKPLKEQLLKYIAEKANDETTVHCAL